MEALVNWIFVAVTGIIAWHGLTYRDADGERDLVRTLFGCIALLFCLRVLFVDVFDLM
ncbi:MAG: hypothetical protein R3349_06865 [Geminicoccaceae bacterium]|nr:hypothetical protein [Geminicoccaceae bacterium]